MCVHATVAIGGVLRLPSSNQSHHVRCLRFRRPTGARAISVPSGRANDQDHPVAAFEGGADFIVPLPRCARGGVADVGVGCGSGSLRRSAQPAGRRCRRSGAGRFQKTPSGVIQGFYVCGTNRGTTFLNYCFYWNNGGVVGSHPDRLVRPDSRWKSGAGAASIARGWRRPGAKAQWRDTRVWRSCGGRCTRVGTDAPCRSIDGRWGRIEPDAPSARSRAWWTSDTAGGGLARLLERSRGARGHGRCPASKPTLSW